MASETQEGTAPAPAGGGVSGLPQFDAQWWPGQIVWFLIIFALMLLFVRIFAAPRVGGTIEAREGKISGDIADARRMKEEAEAQAQAAAAETAQARAAAQRVAADARAKAQAEVAASLAAEEAKLAEAGAVAEARIARARDAAMANVASIASEAAGAIVSKLTGKTASVAELKAAAAAWEA
jgi:F-type H+-transporting ATPase subunit b